MALPTPQYALAVGETVVVGSKTDDDKRYTIERMDTNAYSCTCMAWRVVSKKTAVDVRTCKHIRDLLGDEHEDARCGKGAGVAKKPSKKKASTSVPPVPSGSRGMSTSAAGASSEPPKRTYAEPGAKKRSVKVRGPPAKQAQGKGKGKAVIEEDEADENDENEAAEAPPKKKAKARLGGIELLLAKKFDLETKKQDPTGWWISEKLDGVRAYWDGDSTLWSRVGNPFDAPSSFTSRLPQGHELDGELFIGRDRFDETSGIVRSRLSPRWADLRYMVFDIPSQGSKPFEARLAALDKLFPGANPETVTAHSAAELNPKEEGGVVRVVEHEKCDGWEHLLNRLEEVKAKGGEGLMLREPKSKYVNKRSTTLLKVKTFYDAEARVVSHEPGKGKYAGLVGALECVMEDGKTKFSVGSGLTDERRANPPPVGSVVTYRFQELTKAGIPRFPTFVGERFDVEGPKDAVLARRAE
ncbi:DNA ligase/mRNA capping enzyme [Rhodotorula diobovata]|uniref:DNA ligase/mRNA capping enzyme n=1 Tax=Rhodotorula diobovata TaxID=5288 RepID=A0A5C5FWF6_9BASI|nr:DNA ligase/mRNA capping enzyme [Rhodotorula diobovata]